MKNTIKIALIAFAMFVITGTVNAQTAEAVETTVEAVAADATTEAGEAVAEAHKCEPGCKKACCANEAKKCTTAEKKACKKSGKKCSAAEKKACKAKKEEEEKK